MTVTARKNSNCSETVANLEVYIDDTAPVATMTIQVDQTGGHVTSPTIGPGPHDLRLTFDDTLSALPTLTGVNAVTVAGSPITSLPLPAFTGTVPGNVFDTVLTITGGEDGAGVVGPGTELTAINTAGKTGSVIDDNTFTSDTALQSISSVDFDIADDNPPNDDNTLTGVRSAAAPGPYTPIYDNPSIGTALAVEGDTITVTVEMSKDITTETCTFDAAAWGGSGTVSCPAVGPTFPKRFQGTFNVSLGPALLDANSRDIGQASVFHGTGDATVTTVGSATSVPLSARGFNPQTSFSLNGAATKVTDTSVGWVPWHNFFAFNAPIFIDFSDPEAVSQHMTNDQLNENVITTASVLPAAFKGGMLSVPNTNGGTSDNPTALANTTYRWRSKKIKFGSFLGLSPAFHVFAFAPGTAYKNVEVTSTSVWDTDLGLSPFNQSGLTASAPNIDIRISADATATGPTAPFSTDWFLTTDTNVSSSGISNKFGKTKDILVNWGNGDNIALGEVFLEIDLITNGSGKAPIVSIVGFSYFSS
jgi:hypothetical protein